MKARLLCAFLSLATLPGMAGLVVEPPPGVDEPRFYEQLRTMLSEFAKSKDPVLRRLYETAKDSPGAIRIRPMTDDKSTWNSDGSRTRGHTDPDDKRAKREGRQKPADATVFLPPDAVEPGKLHWKSGTLAHELVHAIDLANGRYNPTVAVRERRATFMQNVWRQQSGHPLRTSYHNRFPTLDYQDAVSRSALDEYANYIFSRADFPQPPQATVPVGAARDED